MGITVTDGPVSIQTGGVLEDPRAFVFTCDWDLDEANTIRVSMHSDMGLWVLCRIAEQLYPRNKYPVEIRLRGLLRVKEEED